MDERLGLVADVLAGADVAVAFTGAGVSTAAGVPDFGRSSPIRGTDFSLSDLHVERLNVDPRGFWRDWLQYREAMYGDGVEPGEPHRRLADLEADGHLDAVITQNTDGLHQAAGSDRVIELHGNGGHAECRRCGEEFDAATVEERARDGELPPACDRCGRPLRPGVVLFGESLPEKAVYEAQQLADECDLMLVLGSSLSVEPGASIPKSVVRDGTLVIVDAEGTHFDDRAAAAFHVDVTEFLSALAERLPARA